MVSLPAVATPPQLLIQGAEQADFGPAAWVMWSVRSIGKATPDPAPPSRNQAGHLDAAISARERDDAHPRWHAARFRVPGAIDEARVGPALAGLIERHATLRHSFSQAPDGTLGRLARPKGTIVPFIAEPMVPGATAKSVLDEALDPLSWPAVRLLARHDESGAEFVLAFEPLNVDLTSLVIAVGDFAMLLGGDDVLPTKVGNYVDFCAWEDSTWDASTLRSPDAWLPLLERHGGALELGLAAGDTAPLTYVHHHITSAIDSDRFERWSRQQGVELYVGLLAALALAWKQGGVASTFCTVVPIQTRVRPEWDAAVGWFVDGVPITIVIASDALRDTVPLCRDALYRALGEAAMPLRATLEAVDVSRDAGMRDRFCWTSFVDIRGRLGHGRVPTSITAVTRTAPRGDEVDFWFVRDSEGLTVDTRIPNTRLAETSVDTLMAVLREVIGGAFQDG